MPATFSQHAFVLPENFDPSDYLKSPRLQRRLDDARYFVSLILRKLACRDIDSNGFVRLMAKHLKTMMHQTDYADVIDSLVDSGVVLRSFYSPNRHSYGYRLSGCFESADHKRVPVTDRRLRRRIDMFHAKEAEERRQRMRPVHFALEDLQRRLRIDGKLAREILATIPKSNKFDIQGILVRDIEEGLYHCNVGRYGRFSNNISNLKRELRQALRVDGKPLAFVDLSCAQPTFLSRIIQTQSETTKRKKEEAKEESNMILLSSPHPNDSSFDGPDVGRFQKLTQSGEFYDLMVSELADSRIDREAIKKRFLQDVIAKKKVNERGDEYQSDVEDTFRRLFPSVYAFVRYVNRNGNEHKNLIRILQREESRFVIETVVADLVSRHPRTFFITLHDAVYTTADNIAKVEAAFKRAFDANGFTMTYKTADSAGRPLCFPAYRTRGSARVSEPGCTVLQS